MLRLWNWLKRLFNRWFGKKRQPPPTDPPPPPPPPDNAQCEAVFMELLEGIDQGWTRGNGQSFLMGKNIKEATLIAWLREFAQRVGQNREQHRELGRRLQKLGNLAWGELSPVAAHLAQELLVVEEPRAEVIEAEFDGDGLGREEEEEKDEAKVWFDRGKAQYYQGDFLGEIASYDRAVEIKRDYHQAWNNRGNALGKLGRYEEAIASYDRALEIKLDFPDVLIAKGAILCDHLGRYEEALNIFDKALEIQPNSYNILHNRGVALSKLGRTEEAIASWDRAVEIKPDFPEALTNRGVALSKLGRTEEAIASYDRAVGIKLDYHQAWNNRGVALRHLGRTEEAIASYDRALEIKLDFPEAWDSRGLALRELGRTEEALASYDRALEIKPDDHEAWNNRGVALRELGRTEEAIASYDRALGIKPDYHEAWLNRGIAAGSASYSAPWQPSTLARQYPQLNQRGFEGELASYQLGLTFCTQDKHPQGWGLLHRFIGLAYYYRGRISLYTRDAGRSDFQEALKHYHQALHTLSPPEKAPSPTGEGVSAVADMKGGEGYYLELIQDLIRVHNALHNEDEVKQWRNQGLDVWSQLLNHPHKSSYQKRQLAVEFIYFAQIQVDVLLEDNLPLEAFRAAEEQKNLYLTWILDRQKQHILSPSYDDIKKNLLNPTTALISWHLSDLNLTTFLLLPGAPQPIPFTRKVESLKPWLRDWDTTYEEHRKAKTSTESDWRNTLDEQLEQLKERLDIDRICSYVSDTVGANGRSPLQTDTPPTDTLQTDTPPTDTLQTDTPPTDTLQTDTPPTDIKNLILIPHLDLHRLPLHALFPDTFTLIYLPSAQVGIPKAPSPVEEDKKAPSPVEEGVGGEGNNLLNIQNPDSTSEDGTRLPPLAHADVESAYITRCVSSAQTLASNAATLDAVTNCLKTSKAALFHFTGHASYNDQYPQRSALYLSQKERLTVQTLSQLNLSTYELACLCACETGITSREAFEKDYVGISSAFLAQGVSHVVSTLWTVESQASALFMMRFYEQRQSLSHLSDVVLLNQIQRWFKQVTYDKLWQWYDRILADLPSDEGTIRPMLQTELQQREAKSPEDCPYSHPYYWAAFTISGRV